MNRICFEHCPEIFDCAERAAAALQSGVVNGDKVALELPKAIIEACATAAESGCSGPVPNETNVRSVGRLARLLSRPEGVAQEYTCGRTQRGREEKRYIFRTN